jgi:hypothetical protein
MALSVSRNTPAVFLSVCVAERRFIARESHGFNKSNNYNCRCIGACHLSRAGALAVWIRVRENITAPDVVSDEELFWRGAGTLSQDLDRYFERLPLLVQRRYLQFDPFDRGY